MKNTLLKVFSAIILAGFLVSWSGESKLEQMKTAHNSNNPSAIESENVCANVFYPLEKDNQWTYKLDAQMDNYIGHEKQAFTSDLTLSVSEIDESSVLLDMLANDNDIEIQSSVQYEDQSIILYPLIELNMILGDMASSLDFEHISGKFMPSEKDFVESSWSLEWETEYKAQGTLEANYDGKSFSAIFSESPVLMNWQVISTDESKEVAAGSFDNLVKINREIKVDITSLNAYIVGKQVNISTTLTIDSDLYYAADIGLIKQEINSASIKLFGIKFPLEVQGSIDLESYTLN